MLFLATRSDFKPSGARRVSTAFPSSRAFAILSFVGVAHPGLGSCDAVLLVTPKHSVYPSLDLI